MVQARIWDEPPGPKQFYENIVTLEYLMTELLHSRPRKTSEQLFRLDDTMNPLSRTLGLLSTQTTNLPLQLPKVLGTFVLWALCGCWGGPKRINFGTEPDPDEIQETAEAFLESMNSRNIHSLHDLVEEIGEMGCWALVAEAIDVEEQPKLAKRLRAGLAELQSKSSESISEMEELFQTTTFDEAKMEDLLRQVAETAPALEQVRCNAIDAGFY